MMLNDPEMLLSPHPGFEERKVDSSSFSAGGTLKKIETKLTANVLKKDPKHRKD